MDPFSITVGILGILGAGSKVAQGLKKVLALRNAPNALLALNNEISEVHYVVQDVQTVLEQYPQSDMKVPVSLTSALERMNRTTLSLESVVAYDLTTVASHEATTVRVDKSRWLRAEAKIQALQAQMREDRTALLMGLNILASYALPIVPFELPFSWHIS